MKLNEAFPSAFLKADDLKGKTVTVTIEEVTVEEIGQGQKKDRKLVIAFRGKDKKLVCNKTNASTIEKLYGDETEDWIGKPISIMPREVEFQGEMVWSIRVSLTKPLATAPADRSAPPPKTVSKTDAPDETPSDLDEVPF